MTRTPRLLFDPEGDEGGGTTTLTAPPSGSTTPSPADWKASLPKELAEDPTISTIPDVATLAKNVIEQRKFIGLKRVAAPDKSWDDTKWAEWHELSGRPKAADEYAPGKVDFPEGMSPDTDRINAAKAEAHKLGLSQKQFEGLTKWYLEGEVSTAKGKADSVLLEKSNAVKVLQDEWKGDFTKNADIARAALQKYGDDELYAFLDQNGLGNHPKLVKLFHKIGTELMEDTATGKGPGLNLNDSTTAKLQIADLKLDENFMKALMKREHAGHEAAAAKWKELHRRAFGNVPVQE